jgi:hypothetical protein
MGMRSNKDYIFGHAGSVETVPIVGTTVTPTAFFTLGATKKPAANVNSPNTGSATNSILFGSMPVSGLSVDQGVDHSISKTLNKDFLITEFGDKPVQITMNGVNFFGPECSGDDWGTSDKQALDFYEMYKLSSDPQQRLHLSITDAKTKNGSFSCVLVNMKTIGPAMDRQGTVPLYSYNMILIGVRRNGRNQ